MVTIFAQEINIWAVVVAALLAMGVGALWYMTGFLGKIWMKENGFKEEDLKSSSPMPYVFMLAGQIALGVTLAWILKATSADTFLSMLRVVFTLWISFVFLPFAGSYMFSMKSYKLVLIDSGYYLASLITSGLILFYW